MKRIFCIALFLLALVNINAQVKQKSKKVTSSSKDADGIDGRMKGPNGEVIYIGEKGGRYYMGPSGAKVYMEYKGNKNKQTKKTVKSAIDKLVK